MLNLYTAQYRYTGYDRFDITVKAEKHLEFAPTWDMVIGIKNGTMKKDSYIKKYNELMNISISKYPQSWKWVLNQYELTLVCFCKAHSFCHRYLLTEYLQKFGAIYKGERDV